MEKLDIELERLLRTKLDQAVYLGDDREVIEDLDSLALVELITFVEEQHGVVLKFDALRKCGTLGEIRNLVGSESARAVAQGTVTE